MKHLKHHRRLIIATYNTHFCQEPKQLIKNICQMADSKGVVVFCLQEVVRYPNQEFFITSLLKQLDKNWSAICHVGEDESWQGMGNCIIWNEEKLHIQKTEKILLPIHQGMALHESVFSTLIAGESVIFQRRAIIGTFKFHQQCIQIANVHLDHIGGPTQRKKQLLYLLDELKSEIHDRIICGDFNTFDLRHTSKESKLLQAIFGREYEDVSKESGWTADINRVNFDHAFPLFKMFIKQLRIHIQRKLDYVWVKGLKKVSLEKLDLPGSDHLPMIAGLEIN